MVKANTSIKLREDRVILEVSETLEYIRQQFLVYPSGVILNCVNSGEKKMVMISQHSYLYMKELRKGVGE